MELTQNLGFHQGDVTVQVDVFPCLNFPLYDDRAILRDLENEERESVWIWVIKYLDEE